MAGELGNQDDESAAASRQMIAAPDRVIMIDPVSANVLRLELRVRGNLLSTASGFIVNQDGRSFLISNWHVLAGRHAETGQPLAANAAIPDTVRIFHHSADGLGQWVERDEPLLEANEDIRYTEHQRGREIDVAALPLTELNGVEVHPFDLALADVDLTPVVGMPISIVGYPLNLANGPGFPICKTGHIATDYDLDYDGRPAFLIDATTREGMSGAPVVMRHTGAHQNADGRIVFVEGIRTKVLGHLLRPHP
jgi:hypothetical protein